MWKTLSDEILLAKYSRLHALNPYHPSTLMSYWVVDFYTTPECVAIIIINPHETHFVLPKTLLTTHSLVLPLQTFADTTVHPSSKGWNHPYTLIFQLVLRMVHSNSWVLSVQTFIVTTVHASRTGSTHSCSLRIQLVWKMFHSNSFFTGTLWNKLPKRMLLQFYLFKFRVNTFLLFF